MNEPQDDLDELLAPKPWDDSIAFRETLLIRTDRRVAWNRRVRLIPKSVAVLAIFGLGAFVGQWTKSESQHPVPALHVPTPEVVTVVIAVPVPLVPESSGPIAKGPEPVSATDAELRAELSDDPAEAARFYRTAGDRYLNDTSDYANAARCYRLFLSRAGSAGLNPEPGDTWLLTSLKNSAFKEKTHAAKNGG